MILVDANVLLYAVDSGAERHAVSKSWLDHALSGREAIAIPWISLLAFMRTSTHPSIYDRPLTVEQAMDVVDAWLSATAVVTAIPDDQHSRRLRELLAATGRGGNLVNDAHLAALAIQHRATIATFDSDFGRFPGVRWLSPESS